MATERPVARDPMKAGRAQKLSAALCLLVLCGFMWATWHWTQGLQIWTFESWRQRQLATGSLQAAPVRLQDAQGTTAVWPQAASPDDPTVYLVDFIYTSCPTVCRALGSEYQQMQQALKAMATQDGRAGSVRLMSVSFDVEHDGPAQLLDHAQSMRADPSWWQMGVPTTQRDTQALMRSLGVVVLPDGDGGFVHNGAIHLLDAQGRLRGLYESGQWREAVAAALRQTENKERLGS